MSGWMEILIEYLWRQSWQIVLICGAVALVDLGLHRASAHGRYWLWLVVLLSLCVPSINVVRLPELPEAAQRVLAGSVLVDLAAQTGTAVATTSATGGELLRPAGRGWQGAGASRLPEWLAGFWLAGVVLYLGMALGKAARIQASLKRRRTDPNLGLECEFVEMLRAVGVRARPRLGMIEGLSQPFVWGVWRGCIYLPEGFGLQGSPRERKMVMAHELAHVLRWDALVNFIQVLVQALFWFHPLVWWLNRRIRHEREKCCDETAIAALRVDSREYGSAIIDRLAAWHEPAAPSSSLAISGGAKDLEDRIKTLLLPGRRFQRRPGLAGVLLLVLTGVVLLVCRPGVSAPMMAAMTDAWPGRITPMDLSAHFNARLDDSWLPGTPGNDLMMLERGLRSFGGMDFDVRGIVQLAGREPGSARFPGTTGDIRLDRAVARIHLLHGVSGRATDETVIGRLILEYADGGRETLAIAYGRHVRDWWFRGYEPVADSRTAMAWTGHNAAVRAEGASLRLYRTTWLNPRTGVPLRQIRYESVRTEAAPFVLGLTVE